MALLYGFKERANCDRFDVRWRYFQNPPRLHCGPVQSGNAAGTGHSSPRAIRQGRKALAESRIAGSLMLTRLMPPQLTLNPSVM
jgi:hypothetical protein